MTHGALMMNSNGMDIVLTDSLLSYRMIGGCIDLYFLMGPTPNAVLEQLTLLVGRPMMPPYWSLGLMQSKWVPALSWMVPCVASLGHVCWQ